MNAVLTTTPKISSQSPRQVINSHFFEIFDFCFSSLRSYGRENCSDYNLAKDFLTRSRKCFAERKKTEKMYILKKWSAQSSYCLGECSVDHAAEVFLPVSKNDKKPILFLTNPFFVFPPYVLMDTKNAVITTSPNSFWRKGEKFSLNVQKSWKII